MRVWFEEKRRIRQYETVTVGYEREVQPHDATPDAAFNIVKATVFKWMDEALREARKEAREDVLRSVT